MDIVKEIFRSYDIRGLYEREVTNDLAYLVGKGFGSISNGTVIVGHDARTSSNALNANLIRGLIDSGTKVIDLGLVTTPMLYYARELLNFSYAIMITASHCAKEFNGFKMCDESGSMYGEKIQNFLNLILKEDFKSGTGMVEPYDITLDYKKLMIDKIKLGNRRLKVVIDCGNGTTSYYNPEIIKSWGVDVIPLYCESDPSFPNHIPDPAVEDNMIDIGRKVTETKSDFGISFDGDGDRIGIVDENGSLVQTDKFIYIIWKSIKDTAKNKLATFDVKCSEALKEGLENLGLKTMFNRTGHSYLKKSIIDNDLDFSGEFSGHTGFADEFYGYDDALYAAGRFLRIMSNSELNVSDYLKDYPKYITSEERYIEVGEENKDRIVNKIKTYAQNMGYELITIDGVRIEYSDGFALVRASNTAPSLTVRFEGKTLISMEEHKEEIMRLINEEL